MEKHNILILIISSALIALLVFAIHDKILLDSDIAISKYQYDYEHYMNERYYTCDELKDEILSYDKYILLNPSDGLLDAYNDRECVKELETSITVDRLLDKGESERNDNQLGGTK